MPALSAWSVNTGSDSPISTTEMCLVLFLILLTGLLFLLVHARDIFEFSWFSFPKYKQNTSLI